MTGKLDVETVKGRGKEEGGLSNKQVYGTSWGRPRLWTLFTE